MSDAETTAEDEWWTGPLSADQHWCARGVTAQGIRPDPDAACQRSRVTLWVGGNRMNTFSLTGTVAELRAVADAITAAVDEIEGEGDVIPSEEAAALSPENPEAA